MSDSISAIGTKPQAPSAPLANSQAQAERPRASNVAPDAANPKKSEGVAAQVQRLSADNTGRAAQNSNAAADINGTEAQGQQDKNEQTPEERQPLTRGQAQAAVESFMSYVDKLPGEMKFMVDEDTNRQVFKIVNPVTKEVVKQFPPDEFLTMIKRLKELGTPSEDNGIFFDEKS